MTFARISPAASALCLIVVLAAPAAAQTVEAQQPQPRTSPAAPHTPAQAPVLPQNAGETRREFYQVLEQYPPALGRVLRLDPTLMTNQAYLAAYPGVAAFIARYPDVPRNPAFYLERYEGNYHYSTPLDPRAESLQLWRSTLEFLAAFSVVGIAVVALFAIVRYIVEYRRWHRISRINAEVHNKILDRFGSNEELLAYVESPAGRRFLEAAPIAPGAAAPPAPRNLSAPYGRMLLSVQVGVVLLALAIGLLVVADGALDEVQGVIRGVAVLAFCLGIGSVASAGASYVLSRKLGLLAEPAVARPEQIS